MGAELVEQARGFPVQPAKIVDMTMSDYRFSW